MTALAHVQNTRRYHGTTQKHGSQLIGHFALVRHSAVNGFGLEIAQVEIEKVRRNISDSIGHLKPYQCYAPMIEYQHH
jgi:hypothetical protein